MEIGFEFIRTIVATFSRRCAVFVVDRSTLHPKLRNRVVSFGQNANTIYVYLKYFDHIWFPLRKTDVSQQKEGEIKITASVKTLSESRALEFGADLLGELTVLCIMLTLVSIGIALRRSRAKDTKFKEQQHNEKTYADMQVLEAKIRELTEKITQMEEMMKLSKA
ncbi:hypothetical protein IE077_000834 [Cardiosporidium cionae]|uniref:Uncharacterized protein n=1 Tax=Cardiosporidium cionae TaxID=476202 RepID=A0ABQ7J6G3_9APIC|nr:hypothetical protein IE077_000834 [Cardiosporidium cionae]|eukprot:KAF8819561.1 hypothetical protein IE077_000834 [Cardiosporidium cionae]